MFKRYVMQAVAFGLMCLIWGLTWLAMKAGIATVPPVMFAGTRFVVAGGVMIAFCLARGVPLPTARAGLLRLAGVTLLMVKALTEALMKQCLILVLRDQLTSLGVRSPFYALLLDPRLARAVVGILENPAAVHTVGRLAALAGMSRSSFAARFAELFEQTPMEFVQRVRLRLGADLLQATELPIKLIAATVGYANRSHFTRSFQAAHGIDPRSYRERSTRNDEASQFARAPSLTDRLTGAVDAILGDETDE